MVLGFKLTTFWNMSLLPLPLDQGFRPPFDLFIFWKVDIPSCNEQRDGAKASNRFFREMDYIEPTSYNTFTHFKTNAKSIDIYRVLGCCELLKNQNFVINAMG